MRRNLQIRSPAKAKAVSAAAAPGVKLPRTPKPPTRKSAPKASAEESLSPAAKEAIAAAATAAGKLPTTLELIDSGKVTKMPEGGGGWGRGGGADTTPENHGSKDYPCGHPDCLTKYTFVLSGVLDSMFRQEAADYIQRHGGRVTSGVTGKTTFLLCGMKSLLCAAGLHILGRKPALLFPVIPTNSADVPATVGANSQHVQQLQCEGPTSPKSTDMSSGVSTSPSSPGPLTIAPLVCRKGDRELQIQQRESQGHAVHRRGWPPITRRSVGALCRREDGRCSYHGGSRCMLGAHCRGWGGHV